MKTFCHDADVRREGKEIGIEIGKEIGKEIKLITQVCRKLRKGKSVECIAEELEEDVSVVTNICDIASAFAPDYDEEKIMDKYLDEYFDN